MDFLSVLQRLAQALPLSDSQWKLLITQTVQDPFHQAFGITSENVFPILKARSQLFSQLSPQVNALPALDSLPQSLRLRYLWQLWLPLAHRIAQKRQNLAQPLIQGILGGQGTGKTTLASVLVHLLPAFGYSAIAFSLDDLYRKTGSKAPS